jgi:hypothetical protein
MKYILQNNQWEITYTDSNNQNHTFYHPTEVLDTIVYANTGNRVMNQITEEVLNQMFPSDLKTEEMINYMKKRGIVFGDSDKIPLPLIN